MHSPRRSRRFTCRGIGIPVRGVWRRYDIVLPGVSVSSRFVYPGCTTSMGLSLGAGISSLGALDPWEGGGHLLQEFLTVGSVSSLPVAREALVLVVPRRGGGPAGVQGILDRDFSFMFRPWVEIRGEPVRLRLVVGRSPVCPRGTVDDPVREITDSYVAFVVKPSERIPWSDPSSVDVAEAFRWWCVWVPEHSQVPIEDDAFSLGLLEPFVEWVWWIVGISGRTVGGTLCLVG